MSFLTKIYRGKSVCGYIHKLVILPSLNKIQKPCRRLHTNDYLFGKMYMEHENQYAYNCMESRGYTFSFNINKIDSPMTSEQYEELMKENWSKMQPDQLFKVFSVLGTYCNSQGLCISNKLFDDFIDYLTDNITYASDKQLEELMYSLEKWPNTESVRTRNFIEVWAALDDACLQRMKMWTHDEYFRYITLFYMLNVTRASEFCQKALNKLASKAKQLTPSQLVQTMFYIGVMRRQPYDGHNLELKINDCFDKLSIDDIAIISMGLFKSKTPIRNMELVSRIIEKIRENPQNVHEVSLAALLKIIRYSVKITTDDRIYKLLDTLQHEIDRLSVMCIVHLALLGTSTLTLHEECLTKIAEKITKCLPSARVKDLERLVLTYGTFNFIPQTKEGKGFFDKIVDELRKPERHDEIMKHSRSFACCVCYLGILGIYPVDLIEKILSPDFLQKTYSKQCYNYGREILTLNNTSLIFFPEHKMNRLTNKEAKFLSNRYTDYVPDENFKKQYNVTEQMFIDIYKVLEEDRGGSDYLVGDHVLTHHQRGDIILCQSRDGKPLTVKDKLTKDFGLLKYPPDNNVWIALVIAGRNALIKGTDTPTGHFQAKIRELNALGYHGILVPWSKYVSCKSMTEKRDYLNNLIKQVVK